MRDAAWSALIDFNIRYLPLSLTSICKQAGIKTYAYSRHADLLGYLHLLDKSQQCAGLAVCRKHQWIIFFDDHMPQAQIRFTVAHELGHILLGHRLDPYGDAQLFRARVNWGDLQPNTRDSEERDADMFAVRFLAPAVVLWALDIHSLSEITALTGISCQAAQYRQDRMELLYRRNMFLKHPLERQVYAQMMDYITYKLESYI